MGGDLGNSRKKGDNEIKFLQRVIVVLLVVIGCLCFYIISSRAGSSSNSNISNINTANKKTDDESCAISFGAYHGHVYYSKESGTVGPPKCLLESKWMKIQQHTVKFPENDFVIDDWLWIDYHDRINVLVEAERTPNQKERAFLIFDQTKYALEGRMSKAIIGGIIEPGEEPEQAARREVEEEMGGLQCKHFYFLGRYRTDVNRGMGWLNSFLATDCSRKISNNKNANEKYKSAQEEVGAPDQERQDLKTITLTQLREAARRGEFLEVQWSATVALALQHPELN